MLVEPVFSAKGKWAAEQTAPLNSKKRKGCICKIHNPVEKTTVPTQEVKKGLAVGNTMESED